MRKFDSCRGHYTAGRVVEASPTGQGSLVDDARAFLVDVRGLIEVSWTQRAEARAVDEAPVDPWEHGAVSWSLLGALVAVYERRAAADGQGPALGYLRGACVRLAEVVDSNSLAEWNDAPGRTREEVLAALDEAAR